MIPYVNDTIFVTFVTCAIIIIKVYGKFTFI